MYRKPSMSSGFTLSNTSIGNKNPKITARLPNALRPRHRHRLTMSMHTKVNDKLCILLTTPNFICCDEYRYVPSQNIISVYLLRLDKSASKIVKPSNGQ